MGVPASRGTPLSPFEGKADGDPPRGALNEPDLFAAEPNPDSAPGLIGVPRSMLLFGFEGAEVRDRGESNDTGIPDGSVCSDGETPNDCDAEFGRGFEERIASKGWELLNPPCADDCADDPYGIESGREPAEGMEPCCMEPAAGAPCCTKPFEAPKPTDPPISL